MKIKYLGLSILGVFAIYGIICSLGVSPTMGLYILGILCGLGLGFISIIYFAIERKIDKIDNIGKNFVDRYLITSDIYDAVMTIIKNKRLSNFILQSYENKEAPYFYEGLLIDKTYYFLDCFDEHFKDELTPLNIKRVNLQLERLEKIKKLLK